MSRELFRFRFAFLVPFRFPFQRGPHVRVFARSLPMFIRTRLKLLLKFSRLSALSPRSLSKPPRAFLAFSSNLIFVAFTSRAPSRVVFLVSASRLLSRELLEWLEENGSRDIRDSFGFEFRLFFASSASAIRLPPPTTTIKANENN